MEILDFSHLTVLLELLKKQQYRHTTVSPATHRIINKRAGNKLANNVVDILGWSRPFVENTISSTIFLCMKQANILVLKGNTWLSKIRVSTIGDQYFIHSSYPTNQVNSIFFGPDTYRFINALKHYFSENPASIKRAVDICTGCGPAALVLAKTFPKAEVFGVDINDSALEFARFNSTVNHLNHVQFINSNLLNDIKGNFDLITANPPFLIDAAKRSYRHGGGKLGYQLALDIVEGALKRLNPGGTLLLYTGVAIIDGKDLFFEEVENKLSKIKFNYKYEEIDPDIFAEELLLEPYHFADRIAAVVLTIRKPRLKTQIIKNEYDQTI
jgi:methylase of polypeptide subunit release factors